MAGSKRFRRIKGIPQLDWFATTEAGIHKARRSNMKHLGLFLLLILLSHDSPSALAEAAEIKMSKQTKECLDCHTEYHPGLVQDWLQSLHSKTSPERALTNKPLARRISSENIPENWKNVVVGCYECHSLNATN